MNCPYLWGVYLHSCSAARDVYVPGAPELKKYCASPEDNRFSCCPNFRSAAWRSRSETIRNRLPLPLFADTR